ncbi:hypothetical protein MRX96_043659 [Rhipicephalus microplus]
MGLPEPGVLLLPPRKRTRSKAVAAYAIFERSLAYSSRRLYTPKGSFKKTATGREMTSVKKASPALPVTAAAVALPSTRRPTSVRAGIGSEGRLTGSQGSRPDRQAASHPHSVRSPCSFGASLGYGVRGRRSDTMRHRRDSRIHPLGWIALLAGFVSSATASLG